MSDLKALKERIDLRGWVERDLGQAPRSRPSGDKAWNFKCPFHHEQKGASLVVYRTYWKCFGACGESGDILDWIAKREGLKLNKGTDFREILQRLGGDPETLSPKASKALPPVAQPPTPALPPNERWQTVAMEVVAQAEQCLWSNNGREALQYLMRERGLHEQTIRDAHLGYIPNEGRYPRLENRMKIPPHSITIPWMAAGALWGVKCRLLGGGDLRYLYFTAHEKHKAVLGSANIPGALYWVDWIVPHRPVLIVEGEFNCLSIWEAASEIVCPVSLGTSAQMLNVRWLPTLMTAPTILTWFDADRAGQKGVERLTQLASYIQPIVLPDAVGKDPNDFWCLSQRTETPTTIKEWLTSALASIRQGGS